MSKSGFTHFVMINPKQAAYSFDGYENNEGELMGIQEGTTQEGRPIYKRFVFTRSARQLRISNRDEKTIEFLRNHPECQDSPNGYYSYDGKQDGAVFKEVNEGRDARLGIDALINTNKAVTTALALKGEELRNVAILCGNDSLDAEIQLNAVVSYANSNPTGFMKLIDPAVSDTSTRAMLKRAMAQGLITKKGFMWKFENVTIANTEDGVIQKIQEDDVLREALKVRLT